MTLEQAMQWPAALEIVRARVKPRRDAHAKDRERTQWWKFSRTVQDLFDAVAHLKRFIACPAQSKRFHMIWCESHWCPSNLTSVFAFDDDFSMGVLTSSLHTRWATSQSTKLETRPRYTTASFLTFPWPGHHPPEVAQIARRLIERRNEICRDQQIGLTRLYNQVDDGAWADLRELHNTLDEAVARAYGWPVSVAHDSEETNRRLLELNLEIATGERPYDLVGR
jgi:hypothetical protein